MNDRTCCDGQCWQGRDCPAAKKVCSTAAEALKDPYEREDMLALRTHWERLDALDRKITAWSITLLIFVGFGVALLRA